MLGYSAAGSAAPPSRRPDSPPPTDPEMISTHEFKRGTRLELDGDPRVIVDMTTQTTAGRGSQTLVRCKLKNLKTGQILDRTFSGGDRVKAPDFEIRPAEYLYDEGGETYYFMDNSSYEQFPLKRKDLEYELGFLRPNDEVRALIFNGACIGIELPQTVDLEVAWAEPGVRGDTVNNALKLCRLETGLELKVPLFVEAGQRIVVDTREARYVRRA
jgi:elongation factor P